MPGHVLGELVTEMAAQNPPPGAGRIEGILGPQWLGKASQRSCVVNKVNRYIWGQVGCGVGGRQEGWAPLLAPKSKTPTWDMIKPRERRLGLASDPCFSFQPPPLSQDPASSVTDAVLPLSSLQLVSEASSDPASNPPPARPGAALSPRFPPLSCASLV